MLLGLEDLVQHRDASGPRCKSLHLLGRIGTVNFKELFGYAIVDHHGSIGFDLDSTKVDRVGYLLLKFALISGRHLRLHLCGKEHRAFDFVIIKILTTPVVYRRKVKLFGCAIVDHHGCIGSDLDSTKFNRVDYLLFEISRGAVHLHVNYRLIVSLRLDPDHGS